MKHLWVFLNVFVVTSTAIGVSHGAEKVVKVDSFDWSYTTSQKESSSTSSLTIKLMANIARRCDSVSGKNLWKVGVFGSESQDGSGERYGYVEQILNKKQTCKTVKKGSLFKLRNLRTRFDVDGVSCGDASFLCVELAKNRDSSVNFELRYGALVNSVVACKPLECPDRSVSATERNDMLPMCINPCPAEDVTGGIVCGNNSVEYDNLCELKKAARCENVPVQLGNLGNCVPKEIVINSTTWRYHLVRNHVNSSLPFLANELKFISSGDDDLIGNDLWQVSFFRSNHKWGWVNRRNHQQQVLNRTVSSQSIRNRSLHFVVPFNRYAIGCEQSPYFCFTFRRNPNASVDFKLTFTRYGYSYDRGCLRFPCSQTHYKAWILLAYVWADVSFINSRSAESRELAIKISLRVHRLSDRVLGGKNMWRISVYGSRNYTGYEPQKLGYTSIALNSNDTNYSPDIIPGQITVFPNITTEFDGSGIGCGDYRYICIELERHPNSEPDFEVTRCVNRKKIMACDRQYVCLD